VRELEFPTCPKYSTTNVAENGVHVAHLQVEGGDYRMDRHEMCYGTTPKEEIQKCAFRALEVFCDNYAGLIPGTSIELIPSSDPYDELWTERVENSTVFLLNEDAHMVAAQYSREVAELFN